MRAASWRCSSPTGLSDVPDYVAENRALWTTSNAQYTDEQADRAWRAEEITWGMFANKETEVGVLGDEGLEAAGTLLLGTLDHQPQVDRDFIPEGP